MNTFNPIFSTSWWQASLILKYLPDPTFELNGEDICFNIMDLVRKMMDLLQKGVQS